MIHKEVSGLHEAAFLLGMFALLSQILALVRDRLLAHTFGAGPELDIYYAAFRIPDLLTVSLGSFVASTVLIPFLVEKLSDRGEARLFFDSIFNAFWWLMVVVSSIVYLAMPSLAYLVAPGFSSGAHASLVALSRIMLLSPLLLGISSLFASITQSFNKFFVYAISPVLYNVGIIAGIVFLYPALGLAGLALGVVFGAFLHLAIQLPVIVREGFVPRLVRAIRTTDIMMVTKLSLPRTLALSAQTLAIAALVALASLMEPGSIAIFNFSYNLQSVPLSIIGVSYSVAAFPTLARLYTHGERTKFVAHVVGAARHIIFWSLPMVVLLVVERAQIVRVILGSGRFNWSDTRLTAAALALFAVSIAAQGLMLLFVRGYYAAGETAKPVRINMLISGSIVALCGGLVWISHAHPGIIHRLALLMRTEDIPGAALLILPSVFSLGMLANAALLAYFFHKDFIRGAGRDMQVSRGIIRTVRESLFASSVMGIVTYALLGVGGAFFDMKTFLGIFFQGFAAGSTGIACGVLVLVGLGNAEVYEVGNVLRRKFWRSASIAPDQEIL